MNSFGSFVKEQRKKIGISSRKLSLKIGKSTNYIYSLENGLFQPNFETACEIVKALRIPIRENDMISFLYQYDIVPSKEAENIMKIDELHSYIDSKISEEQEIEYNKNYPENTIKKLKTELEFINVKLEKFIDQDFDVNDYQNKHDPEKVITTLSSMFEKELMFRWFVQLMSIPLQTVNNVDIQKDICFINLKIMIY